MPPVLCNNDGAGACLFQLCRPAQKSVSAQVLQCDSAPALSGWNWAMVSRRPPVACAIGTVPYAMANSCASGAMTGFSSSQRRPGDPCRMNSRGMR